MHVLYGFLRKNKIMIIIVVVVFIYYITSFGIGALSAAAGVYICVSVPVESPFSTAGFILNNRRSSCAPYRTNMVSFFHDNCDVHGTIVIVMNDANHVRFSALGNRLEGLINNNNNNNNNNNKNLYDYVKLR